MTEQWTRWEPIQGLHRKYYVESISDTVNGFELLLSDADDEKKIICITFKNSIDSYKRTDETYKDKLVCNLVARHGRSFHANWTFFKVANSSYIQQLSEESGDISGSHTLMHFSILASDSVVDIIAGYEPIVELIKNE